MGACTSRRWESHGVGRDVSEFQGEQKNLLYIAFASKRIYVCRLASGQWPAEESADVGHAAFHHCAGLSLWFAPSHDFLRTSLNMRIVRSAACAVPTAPG